MHWFTSTTENSSWFINLTTSWGLHYTQIELKNHKYLFNSKFNRLQIQSLKFNPKSTRKNQEHILGKRIREAHGKSLFRTFKEIKSPPLFTTFKELKKESTTFDSFHTHEENALIPKEEGKKTRKNEISSGLSV